MSGPGVSGAEGATEGDGARPFDVAVVGMAGRFPGADDVAALWGLLAEQREGIIRFTVDELVANGVDLDLVNDPAYVPAGSVLNDVEAFDAPFFGFTPAEARLLDPQQRLFLEEVWHALEDAGHDPRRFGGSIGVFAGSALSSYLLRNLTCPDVRDAYGELAIGLANDKDSLSTRVAYLLDLHGPCYNIQSYCSTSLVAVCAACSSLVQGECDMALAGGVSVSVPHRVGYLHQDGGMTSPDGHCRAFDAAAQGTPVGSGVGVVALRRLDDALADGDDVRAVLRGWAVNNDGGAKVGFTAPGVRGEADVVVEALAAAGVEPSTVDYIEAHGTGTALGDAAEIAALQRVFGSEPCLVGSVKTNVGHLDRAAGVTGLIKTVLAIEHETIPATLHFSTPNPQILEQRSVRVAADAHPWPRRGRTGRPRRAGVSSFGIGGTNAHVVMEEPPEPAARRAVTREHHLLMWSARDGAALDRLTDALHTRLAEAPAPPLGDVAFTLQTGRATLSDRRALVASSVDAAVSALTDPPGKGVLHRSDVAGDRPVGLLISGVGEQYTGMVARLHATEPVFRDRLDSVCRTLAVPLQQAVLTLAGERRPAASDGPLDLRSLMGRHDPAGGGTAPGPDETGLARTEVLQPAVFVVDWALAETWREWGVVPSVMLGYSLGEYVAACLSGVLSFGDALALVTFRAELISQLPAGAMAAVGLGEQALRDAVDQAGLALDVAGVNGPQMTVVAGLIDQVDRLAAWLDDRGVALRRLETTHAFHSRMLAPAADELSAWVRRHVSLGAPRIPYLSNVTGGLVTADEATDPEYWARHMCSPVRFADGVAKLLERPDLALLEVGPGPSLGAMVRGHPACGAERWPSIVASLPARSDPRSADAVLAEAAGRLWLQGVALDWTAYNQGHDLRRTRLALYPFDRQRHWIDAPASRPARARVADDRPVAGAAKPEVSSATWLRVPVWRRAALKTTGGGLEPTPEEMTGGRSNGAGPGGGHVLVLADVTGVASRLVPALRDAGAEVTVVGREGTTPARLGALLADGSITTVVHLWSLDAPSLAEARAEGILSIAAVARALGDRSELDGARLVVVTPEAEMVVDGDVASPEAALLVGPALVAGQEYPLLRVHHVDVPRPDGDGWAESSARAVLGEVAAPAPTFQVAYRRSERFVPGTEERALTAPVPRPVRRGGVYLLTGGLGNVGLLVAEHLARHGAGAVVLTGRSALSDAGTGDPPADEPAGPAARTVARVRALRALGTDVWVRRVDVTDAAAMGDLIAGIRERFGRLDGVVHAAAVTAPEAFVPLAALDEAAIDVQLAPKVDGAVVLEQVLADQPLDFCLLMSSISTLLGGLGFAPYAAANLFLDAVVHRNRAAGRPWLAVDWDTWAPTTELLPSRGLGVSMVEHTLPVEDGLALLDAALYLDAPRTFAGTGDLDARLRQWSAAGEVAPCRGADERYPRPDLPQEYVPPVSPLERQLAELWSEAVGVDLVGTHDNFFDLGGTSLTGLQLLRRIKQQLGVAVPAVALFEAPTVATLAAYLGRNEPAGPRASETAPPETTHATRTTAPVPGSGAAGIAVVGMAGRFPGAASTDELWHNLVAGVESIRFFTDDELLATGVPAAHLADDNYVRARPVLDDVRGFDAGFFGYSPKEAALTDPQQRLFLECCWQALEHAGYGAARGRGRVGVFGGANLSTYLMGLADQLLQDPDGLNEYQVVMTNDKDALTTVVSYRLDLAGPSMAVQTFCSTSLVAVHLAARSLGAGECEMALAGGVSVRVPDRVGHHHLPGGMESPDGHVRAFDAEAGGSMFGDGAAVVVLKPLADAQRDGDNVLAVIRGSAVNNDGARKVGFTAPSVVGQARVVGDALADAGVRAEDVSFVEAHGTATELGDPIEVAALTRAFATPRRGYCALGSVKTNVGHLDRAAGATGLIKAVLALHHGVLPPSLHFTRPNPELDLDSSPFFVNTVLRPLPRQDDRPVVGGVSSLGMGGTNAHVVVEQAPSPRPRADVPPRSRRTVVIPVSARSAAAADRACERLAAHLRSCGDDVDLRDVAWTLQVGRERFTHRRVAVVSSPDEAVAALESAGSSLPAPDLRSREEPRRQRQLAFVFGGAPFPAGGLRELAAREPVVTRSLATLGAAARELTDVDLVEVLTGAGARPPLTGREAADVVTFAAGWVGATLLRSWGLEPVAVLGTGIGEITAACVAGVLPPEHALAAVQKRACLLAPLKGRRDPASLAAAGETFGQWVSANVALAEPQLRFVPTSRPAAGAASKARPVEPSFWRDHTATVGVLPAGALRAAAADDEPAFVALSPEDDAALRAAVARECPQAVTVTALGRTADGDGGESPPDDVVAVQALADLWLAGVTVDWAAFGRDVAKGRPWQPRRVPLPAYPFERTDHWLATPPRAARGEGDELPRLPTSEWLHLPVWHQTVFPPPGRPNGAVWLVFTDEGRPQALLDELISRLGATSRVVAVRPGATPGGSPADGFSVRPGHAGDIAEVAHALAHEGIRIDRILHLWGAVDGCPGLDQERQRGFHTLVACARAMADLGRDDWQLDVVAVGACAVIPGEVPTPERALLLGPVRVVPLEYPGVAVRLVDLDGRDVVAAAAGLSRELFAAGCPDRVVALRAGTRWVPDYRQLPAPATQAPEAFVEGGTYLVTGGLGGIGLAVAERLARDHRARLVLLGRTGLPPRQRWPELLAATEGKEAGNGVADLRRRLEGVLAIEAYGGQVEIVTGDVAVVAAVEAAVARAVDRFGRLDGVLHIAGVPGMGLMQFKNEAAMEAVLSPKVAGAEAIERAIQGRGVDLLVLFSSIASVTGGGPGQVDYCAANAFLDAYARDAADRAVARRVVALTWGEWTWTAWSNGLEGFDPALRELFQAQRARLGMDFEEGWEALRGALATGESHVVVSTQDFAAFARLGELFDVDVVGAAPADAPASRQPRPALSVSYVAPRTETEATVAALWAAALGVDRVGVMDDFFELGGSSLVGVDLVARIRRELEVEQLPPKVLYEAPTVEAFANHIERRERGSGELGDRRERDRFDGVVGGIDA